MPGNDPVRPFRDRRAEWETHQFEEGPPSGHIRSQWKERLEPLPNISRWLNEKRHLRMPRPILLSQPLLRFFGLIWNKPDT